MAKHKAQRVRRFNTQVMLATLTARRTGLRNVMASQYGWPKDRDAVTLPGERERQFSRLTWAIMYLKKRQARTCGTTRS